MFEICAGWMETSWDRDRGDRDDRKDRDCDSGFDSNGHRDQVHMLTNQLYQLNAKFKDAWNEKTGLRNMVKSLERDMAALKSQLRTWQRLHES